MADYLPLSEQLRILFEAVRHTEGHPYTLQEVSAATGVSLATISQMRNGKIQNPQLNTLRALGEFFHIPLRYFETRSIEECYQVLKERQQPPEATAANEIAFRASHLSEQAQRDILTMIKWVQAAEQQHRQGNQPPPLPSLENYDE
jgi:transcriptional regulator with XRE-family HTH domain